MWQSSGLMAMAAFRTTSSLGPAVGMGASPTSRGVLALRSHAALFDAIPGCFSVGGSTRARERPGECDWDSEEVMGRKQQRKVARQVVASSL